MQCYFADRQTAIYSYKFCQKCDFTSSFFWLTNVQRPLQLPCHSNEAQIVWYALLLEPHFGDLLPNLQQHLNSQQLNSTWRLEILKANIDVWIIVHLNQMPKAITTDRKKMACHEYPSDTLLSASSIAQHHCTLAN